MLMGASSHPPLCGGGGGTGGEYSPDFVNFVRWCKGTIIFFKLSKILSETVCVCMVIIIGIKCIFKDVITLKPYLAKRL